jgi:hypothetical protein
MSDINGNIEDFNNNDKQHKFNEIKGVVIEINDGDRFGSITLMVGHEKPREVNVVVKKSRFDLVKTQCEIGEKVTIQYYLTSRFDNNRWYTIANLLSVSPSV